MTQANSYLPSVDEQCVGSSPTETTGSIKPAVWSAILMAIGGMGDALLYAYLPVKGEALGLTALSIGILLSINKFARFFTNRWIAYTSYWWGIKNVLLLGVVLSAFTTCIYALNPAVWVWVLTRILWGAAFSALRFSTLQYAITSTKAGSALGISRSVQELGPLLAYWTGPFMLTFFGHGITFTAWAFFLVTLLPIFLFIPALRVGTQSIKPFSFQKPEWIDFWIFISSYSTEGVLIVGISRLLSIDQPQANHLLLASALYISIRRLFNVIMSPLSGWLSDTFGFLRLFQISCLLIITGLGIMALNLVEAGILITFIGSAINTTIIPIVVLEQHTSHKSFDILTRISTSRDLGSALGALTGIILLEVLDPTRTFTFLALLLLLIWFKIYRLDKHYE